MCPGVAVTPCSYPQPLVTTGLHSISRDLLPLDISYKCSPTVCDLWGWASFSPHSIFQVSCVFPRVQNSFLSRLNNIPSYGHAPVCWPVYCWGTFSLFSIFGCCASAAKNRHAWVFESLFSVLLSVYLRNGVSGSYGNSVRGRIGSGIPGQSEDGLCQPALFLGNVE